MIAGKWEQIKELFESALDCSPKRRKSFLVQLRQEDPAVAEQVAELLASYEKAGDFLVQPCCLPSDFFENMEAEQQRFFPSDVLCGRFRIVGLIGRGGMGEVYKAWDEELEDHVALKILRFEISTHELFTSRFRREIQLARRVTHPNVCRIFDSFKHAVGDGTYISVLSMELLQGQTLAEYLKAKGRLTAGEALPIAQQIIAGLGAIHAAGIIHRDLKPSNLVLVPGSAAATTKTADVDSQTSVSSDGKGPIASPALDGTVSSQASRPEPISGAAKTKTASGGLRRAEGANSGMDRSASADWTNAVRTSFQIKITDFGIAGRIPDGISQAAQTEVSKLMGTPDYMAPEQLEHARTSVQSDIYSLGLVLYEMATGVKPFAGASAWKRITTDPLPPRKLAHDLPENWNKTIACCLERNPEYRFQRSYAVVESLEESSASAVKVPPKPLRMRVRHAAKSKLVLISIFLMSAVALFAVFLRSYPWKPKLPEGATVLFPEIVNITADQQLEAVTDLLRNQLAQSPKFSLLERSQVNAQFQQMGKPPGTAMDEKTAQQTARDMAWRLRANLLLLGTLSRSSNGYQLKMIVEETPVKPDLDPRHWEQSFAADNRDHVFDAVRAAGQWFRSLAEGRPLAKFQGEALPQATTTSSWEALLCFSQAERLKAAGQTQRAIDLLEESVQLDHDFSLAYMRLGDLYDSLGQEKKGFEHWQKALQTLSRRRVTQKEELRIRGLFAQDSGDFKTAEETFRTFEILYPHEYLASFYLASTLADEGRLEEALAEMKLAEQKQPDAYPPVAYEARLNLMLDKFDDAAKSIQHLRTMHRDGAADSIEVGMSLLLEDFPAALRVLDRLQASQDSFYRSKSYSLRAAFLRELGNNIAAIRALKEGISFDRAQGLTFNEADKWIALAYTYWKTGDAAGCRNASLSALKLENGRLHLLRAGTLLARAGFVLDAKRVINMLALTRGFRASDQARHQIQGELFAAQNQKADALSEMRNAADVDIPANPKEYLARVLESTGHKAEALQIYREIVRFPAQIWQALDYQYPGFWGDMDERYATLELNKGDPTLATANLRRLRMGQYSRSFN